VKLGHTIGGSGDSIGDMSDLKVPKKCALSHTKKNGIEVYTLKRMSPPPPNSYRKKNEICDERLGSRQSQQAKEPSHRGARGKCYPWWVAGRL